MNQFAKPARFFTIRFTDTTAHGGLIAFSPLNGDTRSPLAPPLHTI